LLKAIHVDNKRKHLPGQKYPCHLNVIEGLITCGADKTHDFWQWRLFCEL